MIGHHFGVAHLVGGSGAVIAIESLLAPIDDRVLASDRWPHLLWVAPGEALPV